MRRFRENALSVSGHLAQIEHAAGLTLGARNAAAVNNADIGRNPHHRLDPVAQLVANLTALLVVQRQTALFSSTRTESESR